MIAAIRALAFAVVLAVPYAAAAECAWLLWRSTEFAGPKMEWIVLSAFPTKRECEIAGRSQIDRELYLYTEDDVGNRAALFCLPDTIDPRRAKTGAR